MAPTLRLYNTLTRTKADFVPQVNGIITVGEFYGLAAGDEIIFT